MGVIVVGAGGFLGSRLAAAMVSSGTTVLPVQRTRSWSSALTLDLRRSDDLRHLKGLAAGATVLYCANVGGRAEAEADPDAAMAVNARIPAELAAVASRFIYFSTDYVFTRPGPPARPGDEPDPCGVYAISKRQGEIGVLSSSATSIVVRVSGLCDELGTRTSDFSSIDRVEAADNFATTPTLVSDVIQLAQTLISNDRVGIVHCVGPQRLTPYEVHLLGAVRWGFEVEPTVATSGRHRTLAPCVPGTPLSSVFQPPSRDALRSHWSCVVLDTVGVVMAERLWKHGGAFWTHQAAIGTRGSGELTAEEVEQTVGAYTLNPGLPRLLRSFGPDTKLVLANNGPLVTFQAWCETYGFANYFDVVLNSEAEGMAKPSAGFMEAARRRCNAELGPALLIDDRADVVRGAKALGWATALTKRDDTGAVERYEADPEDVAQ